MFSFFQLSEYNVSVCVCVGGGGGASCQTLDPRRSDLSRLFIKSCHLPFLDSKLFRTFSLSNWSAVTYTVMFSDSQYSWW